MCDSDLSHYPMFAEKGGGHALSIETEEAEDSLYVLATDEHSDSYFWAQERQKLLVSFFWLWECFQFRRMFDLDDMVGRLSHNGSSAAVRN